MKACQKMRLSLGHFLTCAKPKAGEDCVICTQLKDLVARHARGHAHPLDPAHSCPVPMCDTFRAETKVKREPARNDLVMAKQEEGLLYSNEMASKAGVRVLTPGEGRGEGGRAVRVITAGAARPAGFCGNAYVNNAIAIA